MRAAVREAWPDAARTLGVAAVTAVLLVGPAAGGSQPYAGLDTRSIAALSPGEIEDLTAGRGMGFALAAELNGYPGPLHVLELAETLALTAEQRLAVEAVFAAMSAEAQRLGAELIAAEAALDALFAEGRADAASVAAATARAGEIRAALRAVHLAAHLETLPLLSRHQRHLYTEARGYSAPGTGHGAAGHGTGGHGRHAH